jgi:predicted RNA-binding Zn-ribbon protein involved in translation (DUF1610 family)
MSEQDARFDCSQCGARYVIIRVEVPSAGNEQVACVKCGANLPARDGRFALKYFLMESAPRRNRRR